MKWITVKTEKPEDERAILINVDDIRIDLGEYVTEGFFCQQELEFYDWDGEHLEHVTHWSEFERPTK